VGWVKAPTGPRKARPDDKLRAVPTRSLTEADQKIGAAIGERRRVGKRSACDLEPPIAGGYIQMAEGQHRDTHAGTEIYIPGAGWRGFDPTSNKLAGNAHVSVAVAREHEKGCPVCGAWEDPANAFSNTEVSVQVDSL
jgi:transglutaminase-like putative cysteine protease